ncbi:hypothetical protein, variant [Puccinia striiformis f. sp. tritici PST-78]|nr:hypothetical protein, variant [Puccinia striiformis f. sp. tritici PST-78]
MYPLFNQPQTANSRENLKGIYKLLFESLPIFPVSPLVMPTRSTYSIHDTSRKGVKTGSMQPLILPKPSSLDLLVVCLSNSTSSLASICGRKMMASLEFGG